MNWTSDSIVFTNSNSRITDATGTFITDGLLENASNIVVTHSLHNNKHFTVSSVAETFIAVSETIVEEPNDESYSVTVRGVEFPASLKLVFASMINTKIMLDDMSGGLISSKKLETFSVTFKSENFEGGYAKSDMQSLQKYKRMSK